MRLTILILLLFVLGSFNLMKNINGELIFINEMPGVSQNIQFSTYKLLLIKKLNKELNGDCDLIVARLYSGTENRNLKVGNKYSFQIEKINTFPELDSLQKEDHKVDCMDFILKEPYEYYNRIISIK